MTAIRNSNFAAGLTTVAGVTTVYTVPIGFNVIIKYFGVYNQGSTQTDANGRIDQVGAQGLTFLFRETIAPAAFFNWSGWVVANGGQVIGLQSANAGLQYWLAGALLPFTPAP